MTDQHARHEGSGALRDARTALLAKDSALPRPMSLPFGSDEKPAELEAELPDDASADTVDIEVETVEPVYEMSGQYDYGEKQYPSSVSSGRTRGSSVRSARHSGLAGAGNYHAVAAPSDVLPMPPLREPPIPPKHYARSIGGSGNSHAWSDRASIDRSEEAERASLRARTARERPTKRFGIGGAGNSVRKTAILRRVQSSANSSSLSMPSEESSFANDSSSSIPPDGPTQYSKQSLESGADKLMGKLLRPIRRRKVEIIE